tara:strand:+ start:207 stop:821 length:615 start_codon:yes stop_codon:yes gene_type:complete
MKRGIIFILLFLLVISLVNAEIQITDMKRNYGLGEEIKPGLAIIPDKTAQAIITAEITCEEYTKIYFVHPIELEANKGTTIDIAPFEVFDKMLGTCVIDFRINSVIGAEIDHFWTGGFEITEEPIEEDVIPVEAEPVVEETPEDKIEEEPIEEEIIEEIKEPSESRSKAILYIFFLAIILLIAYSIYIKLNHKNKNDFNKGWKL